MTPDAIEHDRQNELLKRRRSMIEAGTLQSCEPLPGDCAPGVPAFEHDKCPSCGRKMSWYPARQGLLCIAESCQHYAKIPDAGPPPEQVHFMQQLRGIARCAEGERTSL